MKKNKVQKTNAMRQLEKKKISYQLHEYAWSEDQKDQDTNQSIEKDGIDPKQIFKTLVLVGNHTGPIVACIPAVKELDLKALAKMSGNKKVEMLHMKDLEHTTGYIRGGCSPIAMKKSFPTYIGVEAEPLNTIIVSAGKRGMQVEITPDDLLMMTQGELVDITDQ